MKYFQIFEMVEMIKIIYKCIINDLNAQHLHVKNMNQWNNKFCLNFEQTNETNKFIMHFV
jgi:hypothetical protein